MSHRTVVSDEGVIGYRSAYASNTNSANLVVGRLVALKGNAATIPTARGGGFGQAVDYPTSTNSLVIGVVLAGSTHTGTVADGRVFTVQSYGFNGAVQAQGTTTNQTWCLPWPTTPDEGSFHGALAAESFNHQMVGIALTSNESTSTHTIAAYISVR